MYRPEGLRQVGLIHPFVTQYSSDRWLTPPASAALPVLTRSFREGRVGGVLTLRILPSPAVHAGGSITRWLEEVDLRDCPVQRVTACNHWYCVSCLTVEKAVELRDRARRGRRCRQTESGGRRRTSCGGGSGAGVRPGPAAWGHPLG